MTDAKEKGMPMIIGRPAGARRLSGVGIWPYIAAGSAALLAILVFGLRLHPPFADAVPTTIALAVSATIWLVVAVVVRSSLKASDGRLRRAYIESQQLFDAIPLPSLVVDADLRVRRANRAAGLLLGDGPNFVGLRAGDVIGCRHAAASVEECGRTPECRGCELRVQVIETLASGQAQYRREVRCTTLSEGREEGVTVLVSTSSHSMDGEDYAVVTLENISELKALRAGVREREERLRAIFDSASDHIVLKDRNLVYTHVNQAFARSIGRTPEQVVGRRARDLFPAAHARSIDDVDSFVLAGGTFKGEVARDIDGATRILDIVKVPLHSRSGGEAGVCVVARDVTEKHRSENDLRDYAERIRSILDSSADGIYGMDADGRCIFCNTSALRLLGFEREEQLLGRSVHEIFHHSHPDGSPLDLCECPVHSRMTDGGSCGDGTHFWRADGSSFPVEYRVAPMLCDGRVVGSVVSFSDLTDRLALQARVRELDHLRTLTVLAGGLAHEINNMLTPGVLSTDILRLKVKADLHAGRALETIENSQRRIKTLADKLLVLNHGYDPDTYCRDITSYAREAVVDIQAGLPTGVTLDICIADDLGAVPVNCRHLHLVFANLIATFVEGLEQEGQIDLKLVEGWRPDARGGGADSDDRGVVLTVSSPILLDIEGSADGAFDPFLSREGAGLGRELNLAAAHAVILQGGGMMGFSQDAENGATFSVFLPCHGGDGATEWPAGNEDLFSPVHNRETTGQRSDDAGC